MKKTELAMIAFIASVSILVAYFLAQSVLGGQVNESVKVKTIEKIDSNFQKPDEAIFNSEAINPAVEVQINNAETETE